MKNRNLNKYSTIGQIIEVRNYEKIPSRVDFKILDEWFVASKRYHKNVDKLTVGDNVECVYFKDPQKTDFTTYNNRLISLIRKV